MVKVITYGTYDLLHHGHIRLLERAKALGDYLIVGVTAEDFDKLRGKINVQQSLMERIEAVRATGIADEIIVEEYEGQKIDDIRRYGVDIFTVGSDWIGKFDYLKQYCNVIYLERTEGVSSSEIRSQSSAVALGMIGYATFLNKFEKECDFVNGIETVGICTDNLTVMSDRIKKMPIVTDDYDVLLSNVDAVYVHSHPKLHYEQTKQALLKKKHVLCESPLAYSRKDVKELYDIAEKNNCVLMEGLRTAYSTAYARLLLLVKTGIIGKVMSVDVTCTSLRVNEAEDMTDIEREWGSLSAWGPTALLPVFQILGSDYKEKKIVTHCIDEDIMFDTFTKIDFIYEEAVATIKVANGMKSEGELIISGTNGYIYVPAPWWKMDYFEVRFENPAENKRFFYQLDGEGIRYELVAFARAISRKTSCLYLEKDFSESIATILCDFEKRDSLINI